MADPIIDPNKVVDYLASGGQTYTPVGGTILPSSQVPTYMNTAQPIVPTTTKTTTTTPTATTTARKDITYYKPGSPDIYVGIRADNPNYDAEVKRLQDMGWTTSPTGGTTSAPTTSAPAPTTSTGYTPPQFTNNNNTVYKEWNEKTGTWDVFDAAGKPIDLITFKNMGLNIDHINTKDVVQGEANQPVTSETQAPTDARSFSQRYADTIEQLGLPTFKAQAEEYTKQLGELQNELNDQIAEINDNPWLAEGVRNAKIKKLEERYEGKIKILTAQTALFNNLYEKGIAEAKYITTGEQQDAKYLMELAQKEIELRNEISQQEFENQLDIAKLDLDEKEYALSLYKAQKGEGESPTDLVDVYANAINAGELSLVDVPDKFQAAVATRAKELAAEELRAIQEQEAQANAVPSQGFIGGLADATYSFFGRLFGF